jgi:hypothetical protein
LPGNSPLPYGSAWIPERKQRPQETSRILCLHFTEFRIEHKMVR